jgi:hypothetical protein
MVFPYMDHDLCGLLSNSDFKLNHSVAKLLMRQILLGMDYIHAVCFIFSTRASHFLGSHADDRTTLFIETSRLQIS